MEKRRLLILAQNFSNCKLYINGYFLRFHRSSFLNNSGRAFCKFLQESGGKITNLPIQKQQLNLSSSSPFCTVGKTPNDFATQKHRTKVDFSLNNLRQGKENINKFSTLGIETLEFTLGRQLQILMIKIVHEKKNGNKWIHICQKHPFANYTFPSIAVPKDAYLLIKGMDSLMNKLADHENNHPICQELINDCLYFDYKLEINRDKFSKLIFTMQSTEKHSQKSLPFSLSIRLFPLLRDRMAKLLAEFDGSQQIEPPLPLPKWILKEVNNETVAEDANKSQETIFYRDTLDYKVDDELLNRKIQIEYRRGTTGTEFIQITQRFDIKSKIKKDNDNKYQYFYFKHIHIEDVQPLLDAMRTMANDLQKQPPISHNQSSIICHQLIRGLNYDYKLDILSSQQNKQLNFNLQTFFNENFIPSESGKMFIFIPVKLCGQIPIDVFYWLQDQMAEILLMISSSSHKLGQAHDAMEKQGTKSDLLKSNSTKNEVVIVETIHVEKLEYLEEYKGQNEKRMLMIKMNQLKNYNYKWILLITRLFFTDHRFVRIFVPEDAYSLVNGMDELMNKIVNLDQPPKSSIFIRIRGDVLYDYGIGIHSFNGLLEFRMESITTAANPSHKPKYFYAPIQLLPLLRYLMAKMLAEFDGSQQIGPPPSPLPKWISEMRDNSFQQNFVTNSEETNKEQWEILRQETLDFIVNIRNEKQDSHRQITIELKRNKRDEESIQIVQKFDKLDSSIGEGNNRCIYFPPIPMPNDAQRLLDTMHALSNDLEEKFPNLQIPDDIPPATPICRQIIRGGLLYDYKLDISISPISKQLDFQLQTITTHKSHKPKILYGPIPMDVFNWLKEKMAEILKSSSNQQMQKNCQLKQLDLNNVNGKELIAYKKEANKAHERLIRREIENYWVDVEPRERQIKIRFERGKSGKKFIEITQKQYQTNFRKNDLHFFHFPKIVVPEDAYPLLDAMRKISNELQNKRTTPLIGENKSAIICQKLVKGLNYNYKLEIHSNKDQQLDFRLQTMPNDPKNKFFTPRKLDGPIPIHIFNWLKEKMAEILADYDEFDRNEIKR